MGRIKELKDKQAKDGLSKAEETELKTLLTEAKAEDSDSGDDSNDDSSDEGSEDEEKAIEEASEKMAKATMEKISKGLEPLQKLADSLKENPKIEVSESSKFIVDPQMGKVSIKQLEDEKIELTDRKQEGKQNYSICQKTVHWVQALLQGDHQKLQILTEGTGAQGGFLVPEDFVNILVEDRRDATVMRQLATVLPVSTDSIHLPNVAGRPKAFWRTETAVKATSTAVFGETVLTPYSLASIVPLSNELVADAQLGGPIVSIVARLMGQALAEEEDKAFWTGNGSGKPTGIDNYSFTTIAAAQTDSGRADALIQSLYRLGQGYRNNASVVANKNTISKIATLKNSNGDYLLNRLGESPFPSLQGRRVYEQNDLVDGKAFVGDFSYYYIADRQGVTVDTSTEATVASQSAFERNLTFVRVEERVDGELTLTNPIVEVTGLGGA